MKLRDRKPNRHKSHNYSSNGYYFVTICTQGRINYFGEIIENEMKLNKYGEIVKRQWLWLNNQYKYLNLDQFVIMPNHFHGIVNINTTHVGTGRDLSLHKQRDLSLPGDKIKPLSQLIGAFKTTSSKLIHLDGEMQFAWQRSFHDRIIRNKQEYINVQNYIINNPANWNKDKHNTIK